MRELPAGTSQGTSQGGETSRRRDAPAPSSPPPGMVFIENWETFYAEAEQLYNEHPGYVSTHHMPRSQSCSHPCRNVPEPEPARTHARDPRGHGARARRLVTSRSTGIAMENLSSRSRMTAWCADASVAPRATLPAPRMLVCPASLTRATVARLPAVPQVPDGPGAGLETDREAQQPLPHLHVRQGPQRGR